MIIYLYGEDSYRLRQKLKILLDKYRRNQGTLNLEKISAESVGWLAALTAHLRNRSMFSIKKMVVLDDLNFKEISAGELKSLKKILENYLRSEDEIIILISATAPPASLKFLCRAPAQHEKFGRLTPKSLFVFIQKEAENRGLKLGKQEINLFCELFGDDTWAIVTELDKLSLSNRLVLPIRTKHYSYYQLMNLLKSGRLPRLRLIALEMLLSDLKEEPSRIFNGLGYGRFFFLPPEQWYQKLADYDAAVKAGKLDYEEALVDLALS